MSKILEYPFLVFITDYSKFSISIITFTYFSLSDCAYSNETTNPISKIDYEQASKPSISTESINASIEHFNENIEKNKTLQAYKEKITVLKKELDSLMQCYNELLQIDTEIDKEDEILDNFNLKQIEVRKKKNEKKISVNEEMMKILLQQCEIYRSLIKIKNLEIQSHSKLAHETMQILQDQKKVYKKLLKLIVKHYENASECNEKLNKFLNYLKHHEINLLST